MTSHLSDPKRFRCLDCDIHTKEIREFYTLQYLTWRIANPKIKGMLCIGCVEHRLGRELCMMDFVWCPLNAENLSQGSDRLRNRLLPQTRSGEFDELTHLRRHEERRTWANDLIALSHAG